MSRFSRAAEIHSLRLENKQLFHFFVRWEKRLAPEFPGGTVKENIQESPFLCFLASVQDENCPIRGTRLKKNCGSAIILV